MTLCLKCTVSGHVQGVFYRASTQREAERLGISGYARNLKTGSVEVLACGEKASLDALRSWLASGPAHARVTKVNCEQVDCARPVGFEVE